MSIVNQQLESYAAMSLCSKFEVVSSIITYYGFAKGNTPKDDDPDWAIFREIKIGKTITIQAAVKGLFKQKWSERAILFPAPTLSNNFSTLFDGVNDHLNFGDNHNFDNATSFSLSMWIRPDNTSAQRCLWSKTDSSALGWGLYHNNLGKIFLQMRASSQLRQHTGAEILTPGAWNHLVLTYSGNQNINGAKFYVNNVLDTIPGAGSVTNTLIFSDNSQIGKRTTAFHYSGHIDEVSFWDKELSASEVDDIWNSGSPNLVNTLSFESDLIHWYRMGDGDDNSTMFDNAGVVNGILVNFDGSQYENEVP